jgi:hypothetical protein
MINRTLLFAYLSGFLFFKLLHFIKDIFLQWLNNGTKERYSGNGRNGKTEAQRNAFIDRTGGRGKRGSIAPRNWFGPKSSQELMAAAANIDTMIDDIIQGILY